MLVVLARHGETVWDHEHRLSGLSNVKLSQKGVKQAKILAKFLCENYSFNKVFSSTLEKSIKTAEIISEFIRKPFQKNSRVQ